MLNGMAREPNPFDELLVPFDVHPVPLPPAEIGLSPPRFFPPPTVTTLEGLLCVGGHLSPEWLLDAYRHGIFPWPMWEDEPIAWWSPNPRAVIELDEFHASRSLRRTLGSGRFVVTCDRDFETVIRRCGDTGDRQRNTWLTPAMIEAYCEMHRLGHAHSVEVWQPFPLPSGEGRGALPPLPLGEGWSESALALVGGTYGVAIGALFAAESMFHISRDASKVALAHLVAHLKSRGYDLLDIQQLTPHTESLGAREIPRIDYLRRVAASVGRPVTFGAALEGIVEPAADAR
jgi:leucyl/phenylalanyl-tRNA--protein transferase